MATESAALARLLHDRRSGGAFYIPATAPAMRRGMSSNSMTAFSCWTVTAISGLRPEDRTACFIATLAFFPISNFCSMACRLYRWGERPRR